LLPLSIAAAADAGTDKHNEYNDDDDSDDSSRSLSLCVAVGASARRRLTHGLVALTNVLIVDSDTAVLQGFVVVGVDGGGVGVVYKQVDVAVLLQVDKKWNVVQIEHGIQFYVFGAAGGLAVIAGLAGGSEFLFDHRSFVTGTCTD
jgi:hypothetical protein